MKTVSWDTLCNQEYYIFFLSFQQVNLDTPSTQEMKTVLPQVATVVSACTVLVGASRKHSGELYWYVSIRVQHKQTQEQMKRAQKSRQHIAA
jgi:hypothetical protein